MTLTDRVTEVTRILTEWPEAYRLAGVLRVVRAMGDEIDARTNERDVLTELLAVVGMKAPASDAGRCADPSEAP